MNTFQIPPFSIFIELESHHYLILHPVVEKWLADEDADSILADNPIVVNADADDVEDDIEDLSLCHHLEACLNPDMSQKIHPVIISDFA